LLRPNAAKLDGLQECTGVATSDSCQHQRHLLRLHSQSSQMHCIQPSIPHWKTSAFNPTILLLVGIIKSAIEVNSNDIHDGDSPFQCLNSLSRIHAAAANSDHQLIPLLNLVNQSKNSQDYMRKGAVLRTHTSAHYFFVKKVRPTRTSLQ
jgi:hypothetical protein